MALSVMRAVRAVRGAVARGARTLSTSGPANDPTVYGATPLADHDPEMASLLEKEAHRQKTGLELIASENFTSASVMTVMGSCLINKYSEGTPGARYYGGNMIIDQIENLCRSRALEAYRLDPEAWGVNVQPYSGSPANFALYTALLEPHDRIMGLNLPSGGHLTHGYYTAMKDGSTKNISATSKYFESLPYDVHPDTGVIDYDQLAERAAVFKPKLIICGASAYPRDYEYSIFRQVADDCGAYLHCDMAHASGLIAAGLLNDPFEHCDVVTSTTHKTLRGPRSGLIFGKRELMDAIDFAVFPMLQGGPHNHQIAGVCTQLKEVCSPEWKTYAQQVKDNSARLASQLMAAGHKLATDGTDNHVILWDLRPHGVTGSKMELIGDAVGITLNKNTIHGDASALSPGAVRIGTPALTSRGFTEADFDQVAAYLSEALELAKEIQAEVGKPLKKFRPALATNPKVADLKGRIEEFAAAYPMPGL